ncbi:hypothetical protein ACFOLC_03490 [Lysobacter cavernae]|uniref:Uncharacterized protein n=1 Tax=Lysobacter cavernae TaxID=1685901 RepID=A0ABV7RK94_9GAMM
MSLNATYITEDTAGRGAELGFPRVSTCVAVVIRLPTELVGWHVTTSTLATINSDKSSAQGAAKFLEYAGAAAVTDSLLVVGHVGNHNPVALRDWIYAKLDIVLPTRAFDITAHSKAKVGGEYHIFFSHRGGADPVISFKKSAKSTEANIGNGDPNMPRDLGSGLDRGYLPIHNRTADFSVKNLHSLRKHFVNL